MSKLTLPSGQSNEVFFLNFIVVVSLVIVGVEAANAQAYPTKPIRLVVPFTPGGGTDVIGRLLAQNLSARLGQQVFVDNRAGAGGRVGAEYVARAAPDGYTLLMTTDATIITAPALFPKLSYQSPKDFAPIGLMASGAYFLVVHPLVPVRSVKDLIARSKAHPGELNFATAGAGSPNHLAAELFQSQAGIKWVHVPYKGSAPGTLSVIAGETDLMFSNIVPAIPQIRAGKLKALGLSSLNRSSIMPEVPTIAESGLPNYRVDVLYAVLAPAGTPRDLVQLLNAEIGKIAQLAEMRNRLETNGLQPSTSTPDELEKLIITEIARWSKVVRQAKIATPED